MANTYSQVNIHCIFVVKGRENIITQNFRDQLHGYLSGILKKEGAFPLAVGGWQDHVHVFYEMPLTKTVSELMRILKASSSKWINEQSFVKGKFLLAGRLCCLFLCAFTTKCSNQVYHEPGETSQIKIVQRRVPSDFEKL